MYMNRFNDDHQTARLSDLDAELQHARPRNMARPRESLTLSLSC